MYLQGNELLAAYSQFSASALFQYSECWEAPVARDHGAPGRVLPVLHHLVHGRHLPQPGYSDHLLRVRPILRHPPLAVGLRLRDLGSGHGWLLLQAHTLGQAGPGALLQSERRHFKLLPQVQWQRGEENESFWETTSGQKLYILEIIRSHSNARHNRVASHLKINSFFSAGFSADSNGHRGVSEASEPAGSPTLQGEPAVSRPLQADGGLGDHGYPYGRPQQQPKMRFTV